MISLRRIAGKTRRLLGFKGGAPTITPDYLATLQLTDARSFLNASKKLNFDDWGPKYYLQIHAIELAGKSFLLAKGEDPERVQRIGHNLSRLFRRCRRAGLQLSHPRATQIIKLISTAHADHRLRYAKPGSTELPMHSDLEDFSEELMTKAWEAKRRSESSKG